MGKHEREQIEKAEKIIVKILNNQKLNESDLKNHWCKHSISLAKKIKSDFRPSKAIHLGNRYDNTGDILIVSGSKKIIIELKMSDTKFGIGTKANISQDALTENHLFEGRAKSWSEFRKEMNHNRWVNSCLNNFPNFPKNILKISNQTSQIEEKVRYLRLLKSKGSKEASEILNFIHVRDKEEKLNYLTYLSSLDQQRETIKRFFILIILGIHRKDCLIKLIKSDNFFQEAQNLYVYYANINNNRIIVRRDDLGEKIKNILIDCSNLKIIFPKRLTHCKIVCLRGKKSIPLLQIVLHWKNIAQGIKTPCLNIFDLSANYI